MRTLIAAVGVAMALTVGAGQAVAAPLPFVDAPVAPVAETGSSSGSVGALNFLAAFLLCILPLSPGCTPTTGGGDL